MTTSIVLENPFFSLSSASFVPFRLPRHRISSYFDLQLGIPSIEIAVVLHASTTAKGIHRTRNVACCFTVILAKVYDPFRPCSASVLPALSFIFAESSYKFSFHSKDNHECFYGTTRRS